MVMIREFVIGMLVDLQICDQNKYIYIYVFYFYKV